MKRPFVLINLSFVFSTYKFIGKTTSASSSNRTGQLLDAFAGKILPYSPTFQKGWRQSFISMNWLPVCYFCNGCKDNKFWYVLSRCFCVCDIIFTQYLCTVCLWIGRCWNLNRHNRFSLSFSTWKLLKKQPMHQVVSSNCLMLFGFLWAIFYANRNNQFLLHLYDNTSSSIDTEKLIHARFCVVNIWVSGIHLFVMKYANQSLFALEVVWKSLPRNDIQK